ncbi:MAG: rhodanese-like domain-containing protein [Acidobacteriota bacterium]|jgi:rhodanese-related sulfurtransferase
MNVRELTPVDVAARLDADTKSVYLDVRSEHEFEQGHPAGALNIPLFHFDPATRQPQPNQQFLAVVSALIERDVSVYIGCASGQRSHQAATLLLSAGYETVFNVDGGFSGKRDPFGVVLVEGWQQAGLPCSDGDGDERSYSYLLAAAAEVQEQEPD